jgi:hypothetical protein
MTRGKKKRTGIDDPRGLGVIKCRICDKPVRDHRIGRCPEALDQTLFRNALHPGRSREKEENARNDSNNES